jgi:hypothetical protein
VLRKILRVVTTIGVLGAGYVGYSRAFHHVADLVAATAAPVTVPRIPEGPAPSGSASSVAVAANRSVTQRQAIDLATLAFGEGHWAADPELTIRYYNAETGYWVYARDYSRHPDGHRVAFHPFALIWTTKDRRGFKAISGDRAVAVFEDRFDPFRPSSKPIKIQASKIEGDVLIRDYRDGGRSDLTIGPLAYLEYDERQYQIRSVDTPVTIRDRDFQITCVGVVIDLIRPTGPTSGGAASGFSGVRSARLLKDVRIVHDNLSSSGFLAGSPRAQGGEKVPFELTCDGEVKVDLPPPAPKDEPSTPSAPTIARFSKNVRLKRGDPLPDQLDCDNLEVRLFRGERPPAAGEKSGALGNLEIRDAKASGHAVWLQSPGEGFRALGNELIYKRLGQTQGDETYFRANRGTGLQIWKTDVARSGPDAGKVTAITTIETVDATLLQTGEGPAKVMTIVARGPGRLESRPSQEKPAERIATWTNLLRLKSEPDERRLLTLMGQPTFQDVNQARIEARESMVVSLRPRPRPVEVCGPPRIGPGVTADTPIVLPPTATSPPAQPNSPSGSLLIEWVRAQDQVRMVAEAARIAAAEADGSRIARSRRALLARKRLDVVFDQPPPPRAVIAGPPAEPDATVAVPNAAAPPVAATSDTTPQTASARPAEPDLDVSADTVWARVAAMGAAGSTSKLDVKEVYLRGGVEVQRGPEAGKTIGTNVKGEAVDLIGQTEGRFEVRAHGKPDRPAEVVSDAFRILGPKLTLNQTADTAQVEGPGLLTQWIDANSRPLVDGVDRPPPLLEVDDREDKRPMIVRWQSGMLFEGRPQGPHGAVEPAHARFLAGVDATIDEARVTGEEVDVYLDRPVSLSRPIRDPNSGQTSDARPQVSFVRAQRDVEIVNRKLDPASGSLQETHRVHGDDVSYRMPGHFGVQGPGVVWLYRRVGPNSGNPLLPPAATASGRGRVSPVSNRTAQSPSGPLELTRVQFRQGMRGRFQGPPEKPASGERVGEFFGDVQILNARVDNDRADLSEERSPPADMVSLYSQYLYIDSQTAAPGSDAADRTRMVARGEGQAARARTFGTHASTIEGDRITYQTDTGVFLIVADPGRTVSLVKSNGTGQPVSLSDARQVLYNVRSGETRVADPSAISLYDAKTGIRPGVVPAPNRNPSPPPPLRFPGRTNSDPTNKENRGFSGGQ